MVKSDRKMSILIIIVVLFALLFSMLWISMRKSKVENFMEIFQTPYIPPGSPKVMNTESYIIPVVMPENMIPYGQQQTLQSIQNQIVPVRYGQTDIITTPTTTIVATDQSNQSLVNKITGTVNSGRDYLGNLISSNNTSSPASTPIPTPTTVTASEQLIKEQNELIKLQQQLLEQQKAQPSQPVSSVTVVTPATPSTSPVTQALDANAQLWLDEHNRVRASLGLSPVRWNAAMAADAATYAQVCKFEHSPQSSRMLGNNVLGENLAYGSPYSYYDDKKMFQLWEDEKQYYTHPMVPNSNQGHYTQIINKNVTEIGCGCSNCSGSKICVCRYNPIQMGNQAPY